MQLRPYQEQLDQDIEAAWAAGCRNVLAVEPTGAGKTVNMAHTLRKYAAQPSIAIAHRKELVGQISLALAREGVPHKIIGPDALIRFVIQRQRQKLGRDFYSPHAQCAVASVASLTSKRTMEQLKSWCPQVKLWIQDEAHHIVRGNQWGRAVDLFPNARGLGFTATPCRADGRGLGSHSDGVMDAMVEGPTMRWLIENKFLCEYEIAAPLSDIEMDPDKVGSSGDYSRQQLRTAAKKSHIVGDVVQHWLRLAKGRQTLLFAPDLDTATEMRASFLASGIAAEMLDGTATDTVRAAVGDKFERGEFPVLINVDLFGEGYDVPAVEVVIMARPTESYGLYCQQFGRALRIMEGKGLALIIDHVGNVMRHGLPDKARMWSLDAKERRPRMLSPEEDIPIMYCAFCTHPYERHLVKCPHCGVEPLPTERSSPKLVDGDLHLLSQEMLAELRGMVAVIDEDPFLTREKMRKAGAPPAAFLSAEKRIRNRAQVQSALRELMGWWMTKYAAQGRGKRECQKLFYFMYNIDVMSAQALGATEALVLAYKLTEELGRC